MHLSRAIVPAEKLRLFSRKNEDKKVIRVGFEPTHSHLQSGGVTHRLTGAPNKSLYSFKYLNVSFFELSTWYSRVILNPTP